MMKIKTSNSEMDNQLQILENIRKVEVPENLNTQLLRRIEELAEEKVPRKWVFLAAACFVIIFSLNLKLIGESKRDKISNDENPLEIKLQNTITYE